MNILLITNSDPANEAAGNEQRTAALHRALCRCGTVYTLLPVKKPTREFLDAARRVQGLCLLPPSRWGLRLARALWRTCFRHLPLPFVWEPARRKAFPGVRFDVVVTRYLTVAAETRAWAFGPCRVDIDDFPDESYATGLAKRHGRLRRAIHLWAIRTWMAWVCGHLEGAWATNAQRVGTLPGLPMVALPNIARPPAPGYAFDAPRRDVLLTVGQMAYPPNHEGVDRFLAEIWPSVRAAFPRLTYRIVGRGAPEACHRRWRATPGVEAAGFVEDLDAAYASALACVAPVDAGSGTCIKTIEALLHGRCCLAAPFAVRGWERETLDGSLGLHVYHSAQDFVDCLRGAVLDEATRTRQEAAGRAYAEARFGFEGFARQVRVGLGENPAGR